MKKGDLTHWIKISSCYNLLFFSQLVNELLFDYSIPSNRIATLNSHYLCLDALTTIYTIDKKGVPEGTIKPIIEELYESLEKDYALGQYTPNPTSYFVKHNKEKYIKCGKPSNLSYDEIKNTVKSLSTIFFQENEYYDNLKKLITDIVISNDISEQPKLFRLTKSLLTELINAGYNSTYIYIIMDRLFWNPRTDIESPTLINEFFNSFSFEKKEYTVVFKVKKSRVTKLEPFLTDNSKVINDFPPRANTRTERNFLRKESDETYLTITEKALDPFSAQILATKSFTFDAAIYKLNDHSFQYNISRTKCGIYCNNTFYRKPKNVGALNHTKTPSSLLLNKKVKTTLDALDNSIGSGNIIEFKSLLNAIQFHSHSLSSISEENQLLDLWAIFESVLNISNKHTSDRIEQICKYLVPILKHNYIYSLLLQLNGDIKNYSEEEYLKIVGSASCEQEKIKTLFKFLVWDEYKESKETFLDNCFDFPLLIERITYYSQILSSPRTIYEFVEKHAKHVRWQIMRIYRNRNLIIHNGDSMPYLTLLIENLHSYVDDFLTYVISGIAYGNDLDTLCQELFIKECQWENNFSPHKGILSDDLINDALNL